MNDLPDTLCAAIADRYRVVREIGRGGMAIVYLADDVKHGRPVAIKVMNADIEVETGPERFRREIEIVARMTHPHILPLYDSGAAGGRPYYVMPYIDGESLQHRLQREGPLPLEDALRLAREIASALGYAHERNLVHRDIKPGNILLSDGHAMVADFGLVRIVDTKGAPSLTASGATVGTITYMSPEQLSGGADVDARADLYALGCLLFEMLAGQPPFTGSAMSVTYQHMSVEPRPVSDLRPNLPGGIVAAIHTALAKLPADRFQSAGQFADALAAGAAATAGMTRVPAAPVLPAPAVPAAHALPRSRTTFIGRERELAECARLLEATRLLTLTGIGGCGKTRLALRLAEQVLPVYPGGVWFVDLAPLQDAERLPLTVAAAIGVRETPGQPMLESLAAELRPRRALLVLDNCEHVIQAAAELVEALLEACPELKFVATSREGLGVAGEQAMAVRSLSVPDSSVRERSAIEASEAVLLFVDRSKLADARFELTATNAPVVAEICRRLDGIPLAIELAAVRVRMLSVEEIRSRLDDRFRLLTGGSKTALPRHQTLQATIDWSFDQLTTDEQGLFRRLSVFAGGCTLDAAVRVARGEADEFGVLELLTRLRDKSLVVVEHVDSGATRYSMLETVRQYAQRRLNESTEAEAVRARHLAFYLALAEEARPELMGPEQGAWLLRLDRELENIVSALAWCERAEGGADAAHRLVYGIQLYWVARGMLGLGYRITSEAVSRTPADVRDAARVVGLYTAGQLGYLVGRLEDAAAHLEESLSIAREIGDQQRIAQVLRALGMVSQGRGDGAAARRYVGEALARSRELNDTRLLSIALNMLAEVERAAGDLEAAEPLCEEFLALERKLGNRGNTASALLNLAMVSIGRGAADRARAPLLEALAIAGEIGTKRVGQGVLEATSGLAASAGEHEPAARFYGAADAQREQMGLHRDPADEAFLAPLLERARGALGGSAFTAAEAAGRAMSYEDAVAEARSWLM